MALVQHPNFAAVRMLLHLDGDLTDVAGTPMAADGMAPGGSMAFVAAPAGWGQQLSVGATHPGGGGSNVVYSAPTAALDLTTTDLTIEARMTIASQQSRPRYAVYIVDAGTGQVEFSLGAEPASGAMRWVATARDSAGTVTVLANNSPAVAFDIPHHLRLTRSGNDLRLFADGAVLYATTVAYRAAAGPRILYAGNAGRAFVDGLDGCVDEVCITAACLSVAPFEPPEGPYANFWPVSGRAWPGGIHTV